MARRDRPRKAATSADKPSPSPDQAPRSALLPRLRWLGPPLAVLLLLGLLYPGPMLEGTVYGGADTVASDAFRQVGDEARAAGDYPFWNPYLFVGMPSFGSTSYTWGAYPPTLLFEFLQDDLGLPPLTWMLGHLLLGGLGMWWLLGRWQAPWAARLVGCVTWLWFARVVAWGVHGHGSKLGAAMAMPWLVGLAWVVLARGRMRAAGLAALVLGLQFLRGHPQISYYTLLVLGLLTVWSLIWPLGEPRPRPAERMRRASLMAAVVAVGFAIGSALLLPVHAYADISTRGEAGASGGGRTPYEYATDWSLAPEDLAAVVMPAAAGFGKATYVGRMPFTDYPNYLGLLVLGLAVASWLSGRRQLVIGLGVITLLALLVAMGRFSPGLYQLCYEALPYFDKLRVPSMAMVVPALLVATLAGLGAAALARVADERATWLKRVAYGVLVVGGLLLLGGATGAVASAYQEQLAALAERAGKPTAPVLLDAAWSLHRDLLVRQGLVLLAAGGALLLAANRPRFRAAGLAPVLLVLVAIDLGSVARLVTHPETALVDVARTADGGGRLVPAARLEHPWQGPAERQLPDDLAAVLQRMVGHDRVLPLGADAGSNAFMTADIRSLGGYHPAKPAAAEAVRQRLFAGVPVGPVARWLGTAAVVSPGPLSSEVLALLAERGLILEPEGTPAGGRMVHAVRERLPRARLVDAWRPARVPAGGDGLEPFLDALAAGAHDPAAVVALDRAPDPEPTTGPGPLPPPEYVADGLDEVILRARTPRPALLLLADAMAPGWRVRVNDEPATLLVADHMLRAVALPAGEHVVTFTYRDPAFARGRNLALVGIAAALLLLAWPWLRRRSAATAATGGE